MRKLLCLLPLVLAGCATPYEPIALDVRDGSAYSSDIAFCQQAAANYRPKATAGSVAYGALAGAAGSLAYAPINPAIPVLGAAGGAVNAAGAGYDVTGQARRNVAKHCLQDRVHMDNSAIVANPDN